DDHDAFRHGGEERSRPLPPGERRDPARSKPGAARLLRGEVAARPPGRPPRLHRRAWRGSAGDPRLALAGQREGCGRAAQEARHKGLARPPPRGRAMNVLVLNCGSSSLRFQVIDTDLAKIEKDADRRLAAGRIERIGSEAVIEIESQGKPRVKRAEALRDHKAALDAILPALGTDIDAVGHRVVHGGEKLTRSVLIDDAVIEGIEECIELAPLHNPANLKGIHAARERFGAKMPQAAVFDTSFHATMPETSYLYALPYWTYVRHKIRRYGFHGTSHRYVAYRYRRLTGKAREDVDLITLHLGNGCSACAIKAGRSVDTSMGLTPLEGL